MYIMILGAILVLLKVADIGPTAQWPWWAVLIPFALVLFWWEVIEKVFGLRAKREQKQLEQEKKDRFDRLYGKNKKP